jgi:hypothetical protein
MKEMNQTAFTHNDVDIFTTLYFTDENMRMLEHKFEQNCTKHYFFIDKIMESKSRVDKMRQIWNIRIVRVWYLDHTTTVDPPLQIIVLDNELPTDLRPDDHGFAVNTVERFDISVCKCVIPNLLALDRVVAMSYLDVVHWEMEYDMQKFKTVEIAWKRILKYSARGFKLCRIRFGERKVIHLVDGNVRIFIRGNRVLSNETTSYSSIEQTEDIERVSMSSSNESNEIDATF